MGVRRGLRPRLAAWCEGNGGFEEIAAFHAMSANLAGGSEAGHIRGAAVSASFFRLLGTEPVLGRAFLPEAVAGDTRHKEGWLSHKQLRKRDP